MSKAIRKRLRLLGRKARQVSEPTPSEVAEVLRSRARNGTWPKARPVILEMAQALVAASAGVSDSTIGLYWDP
jgi:hypothetical protein